jgi:hypothetical protein
MMEQCDTVLEDRLDRLSFLQPVVTSPIAERMVAVRADWGGTQDSRKSSCKVPVLGTAAGLRSSDFLKRPRRSGVKGKSRCAEDDSLRT